MQISTGKFVIAVHKYKDTQYSCADYPNSWFVSHKKYALGNNLEKIRIFNTFEEAEIYIKERRPQYKTDRKFEVLYLTGKWWEDNTELNNFFSLENVTSAELDEKHINEEISRNKCVVKGLECLLGDTSKRATKTRNELEQQISDLKLKTGYLMKYKKQIV